MTTQEYVAPQGQTMPQQNRQSNPYWYRENASYLYGVTNAPSNMQLGIEDISIKPATANQTPHGILGNGLLRTIVGSISFQVRLSKSQAPFVQTISTPIDKDKGEYWDHIILRPQVKAQILRFYEALASGQVPMSQMPMQQSFNPMQQQQQQFNPMQPNMYQQQPMGMNYMQQQMPMQNMYQQQQFGGMPQQQQQFQQFQQFPQQQQQQYTPPAPQDMSGQQEQQQTDKQSAPTDLVEDDLPI